MVLAPSSIIQPIDSITHDYENKMRKKGAGGEPLFCWSIIFFAENFAAKSTRKIAIKCFI
jgi:hypothetical protein